ncbi:MULTISPECIES: hypothetical protein [Flavobacteriaceae]|uniref:hypothetical protein n=1 Tax=Flavobacteriaceae TaxID=49546 RepID=UPI001490F446|nr:MULTISPECIES: hypothetical protein [Allomuricauda]MDC6366362.1 hypothetical protein [Muricauda sp. AC10]
MSINNLNKYFIILSLLFFSCSNTNDPVVEQEEENNITEVYFTLNVGEGYMDSFNEKWILVHDDEGNLLNYAQYKGGSTIIFETEKTVSSTLFVTDLTIQKGNTEYYNIKTHSEIPKGAIWDFESPFVKQIEVEGQFDLKLTNIPQGKSTIFSNIYGQNTSGWGGQQIDNNLITSYYTKEKQLGANDYLITTFDQNGSGNFKHTFLEYGDGTDFTLDYEDFESSDDIVDILIPPYNFILARLVGFEETEDPNSQIGYTTTYYNVNSSLTEENTTWKFCFIDRFPKYNLSMFMHLDGYSYATGRSGGKFRDFNVPTKPNLNITNPAIDNFIFNIDIDFDNKEVSWEHLDFDQNNPLPNSSSTWTFLSRKNYQYKIIPELPEDILNLHPTLNVEELDYKQIQLSSSQDNTQGSVSEIFLIYN